MLELSSTIAAAEYPRQVTKSRETLLRLLVSVWYGKLTLNNKRIRVQSLEPTLTLLETIDFMELSSDPPKLWHRSVHVCMHA